MTIASVFVIARKHSEYAVAGLLGVVVSQALGYGLIFDVNFFLRNLSVIGGLLMVLSDSWVRKRLFHAGLPQIDERDRKMYIQFAGRVLLIFLFGGFVFAGDWGFWRVFVSILGFLACIMVVVGFKAKWSAILLVVILSIFNLLVNNWWTVCIVLLFRYNTNQSAPHPAPQQGLCQVRLFPSLVDCVSNLSRDQQELADFYQWRSSLVGQHGPRPAQRRREKESVLIGGGWTVLNGCSQFPMPHRASEKSFFQFCHRIRGWSLMISFVVYSTHRVSFV